MKNSIQRNRILIISFMLVCSFSKIYAQQYQTLIQSQLENIREKNKWLASDIHEWNISDQNTDNANGLTHIYIQQQLNHIIVYNAISVFVIKGNDIVYFKPGLIDHLQNKINSSQAAIDAQSAISNALTHLGITVKEPLRFISNNLNTNTYFFESSEISPNPIKVQLVYKQTETDVRLAWDVSIDMKHQPHWWNIRIDAMTGNFIDQNDYTVDCGFGEQNTSDTQTGNADDMFSPGPSSPTGAVPTYRVFPYPVEAASFGSRALLTDPSSPIASPYGWHDVNGIAGEEYTITRGNNVYAYEDINNDNLPGYSPNGGTSLTFDFPFTNGVSQITNEDAGLTNLFYACNTIHDYLYPLGFNEVAGNFQLNNYGNGGAQNDQVKAEGLDGSGSNNANFNTPPDGNSGRMQMYLWNGNTTPCTNLNISSTPFTGSMTIGTALFSPQASVTANVILVNDGVAPVTDACSPIVNNIAGKIALIDRGGTCTFYGKAQIAQAAGAIGVIIANNVSGAPPTSMSGSPALTIPTISISLTDGNTLKSALLSGTVNATINTCTVYPIDASFDNGVISHEYGHGLSNRLTGGPSQASCLSNVEQGGEGWSDRVALMMTIEAGDQGTDARGIGTFVKGQPTNGPGIRRYPYSTNMSINPQTYASLASSTGPHQIGEIWCDAIWDMSWKLIDALGFNSNPTNTTSGNNIAMRLVIEGMKLQPCNPGYLDARDAILNADAILYNNAHRCLLWQAFAGRGMGFNAVQGSSNAVGDETAGFSMPPFCLAPTQIPLAAFTSDSTSISCGGNVHFTDQSVQAFNWLWKFGDQTTSILQNPTHTFTAPGTYSVKLIVSNPLGADSIIHIITVTPTFTVTLSATPTSICGGSPVALNAVASGSSNKTYLVTSIPYAPLTGTATTVALTDDQMSSIKPIGFTFNFYGQNYTDFYICSNGFITFSLGMPASVVYGEPLPTLAIPNNLIALAWNDLNPQNAGSTISYFTTGTAPNRKLVVTYNTSHYLSTSLPFVVQAILYEGSNLIEFHTTSISDASTFDPDATTTQGVENTTGSSGVSVPGRNSALFSASNDAYRFTPAVPYVYTWLPGNLNGASQTVNPISTTTYTVKVTDGTACLASFTAPVITVIPCTVNLNLTAFIQGYYTGASTMQPVLFNEGMSTNQTICDSVKIELRNATSPYGLVATSNTILNRNGTATPTFNILPGPYYIVVKHRTGLETWSANPVLFSSNPTTYNFSTAANKAFGNNMKQMSTNVWAIYSGEINKDENIDLLDYQLMETAIFNFTFGYFATDINGDGNVDLLDTPGVEENINNFIFSNHP